MLRRELGRRGLGASAIDLIAPRLLARFERCQPDAREALLDGAALACVAQQDLAQELERSIEGLAELERMMGAFSGELGKLDEVLEVLAAYVRRMRSSRSGAASAPGADRGLLH